MNKEEIIEMAKQAGLRADGEMWFSPTYGNGDVHISHLESFAKLVAEKERKACVELCLQHSMIQLDERVMRGIDHCIEAIRARGQ